MEANEGTIRQRILGLIRNHPRDAVSLARELGIRPRGVEGHLEHLARSVERAGEELRIHPSVCLDCGFTFRDRGRPSTPSRCPKCKSEQITPPSFEVVAR